MYDHEMYANLRKEHPRCFEIAERLYHLVVNRGQLLVRGLVVQIPSSPSSEIARAEIVGINHPLLSEPRIMFRLNFSAELNTWSDTATSNETSLQVSGPSWEGKLLRGNDLINHLATFVHEWTLNEALVQDRGSIDPNPWVDWKAKPFVGCLVVSKAVQTEVRAHHPLMLPFISMCLGSFEGSFEEKLEMVRKTGGGNENNREEALRLFRRRFVSFVAQAHRESVRDCLGSLFES